MPSVGYAGRAVIFTKPDGATQSLDIFEGGRAIAVKPGESFDIDGSLKLDFPQSEEIVGVVTYSLRTVIVAPRLKEVGLPVTEDAFSTTGSG